MARPPRQIQRLEFAAGEQDLLVAWMTQLADAGDGWVNIVPRVGDGDQAPAPLRFVTLFSGNGPGVSMCTWVPGGHGRHGATRPSLGITHATGRRAVADLASLGTPVPSAWAVEQDHPRRGLVLRIPLDEAHEQVLAWSLRAVAVLAAAPVTRWRADIHLAATT